MPRRTFEYEIDTKGIVFVHKIEIEGYHDDKDEIEAGRQADNPDVYKGKIEDVLLVDDYFRYKVKAYGQANREWTLTFKIDGKVLKPSPIKLRNSTAETCFENGKLKWNQ